ncbi:HNH endonuclease [Dyella acidisoli]|uniref:HNH endonuclease 5 domain-containing protein n=1 Tax=Dyella acidisoli TaxID=1867834 RepID=A0ABQ5XM14_9GAMM|nr:HNH endonuclease [Dyella acidisoli]GLQ91611.1 hypothetical protein GCM10007901_05610 [Dyella acidisoli]
MRATTKEHSFCILCLDPTLPLTDEHIFPEAAGGDISDFILCKSCNSKLGHTIDAAFVNQAVVRLARATYRVAGKQGHLPRPFDDIFMAKDGETSIRFKLDENWKPTVVGQAPEISFVDGLFTFKMSLDFADEAKIPSIVRKAVTRFFKNGDGKKFNCTDQQIEAVASAVIAGRPFERSVDSSFTAPFGADFDVLFAEQAKVIYEICCIEFGLQYIESRTGSQMRNFLIGQSSKEPLPWNVSDVMTRLNSVAVVIPPIDKLIDFLTQGKKHEYHIALVMQTGVVLSMIGIAVAYRFDAPIVVADMPQGFGKVYISSLNGAKTGVFDLSEFIPAFCEWLSLQGRLRVVPINDRLTWTAPPGHL